MLRAALDATRRVASALGGAGLCEVCRGDTRGALCGDCIGRFAVPAARCPRCALRQPAARVCGACLHQPPPWTAACTALDYAFPWHALVAQLKFHGRPELAAPLAALLAEAVRRDPEGAAATSRPGFVLVPVPLGPQRLAERGYDQAWELTRALARRLGADARPRLLRRVVETPRQSDLSQAERLRNLRAAFSVAPADRAWLAGRELALVDDVMTTGATLRAATEALLRAGAAAVHVWVLARTPEPGSGSG
jgi:ComF family protein